MGFSKATGHLQRCSFCGEYITGHYGLSIKKPKVSKIEKDVEEAILKALNVNVWVCLHCIMKFADFIKRKYKENQDEIMLESI